MGIKKIEERVEIPEGVDASVGERIINAKGPKGSSQRKWNDQKIKVSIEGREIVFMVTDKPSKRERRSVGTLVAHTKNLLRGAKDGFNYKLKICSGHFPMNVSVAGKEFVVKNFLGEKTPRKVGITPGVKVVVQGTEVTVEGVDKEQVAQTAADIEQLTRRTNYDKRIFQDGIYIVHKDNLR